MIALIGIKKNIPIQIREEFSIKNSKKEECLKKLLDIFSEVVLLSTCNRTEIYFNHSLNKEEILKKIFDIFEWDNTLMPFVFYSEGREVTKHLIEVACGYHSKIAGEDQILGQIKNAYSESLKLNGANKELGRLFQQSITCGKKFKTEAKLYEIPVSSVSVAVSKLIKENCKKVMVIGYGEIGKLTIKYLLSHKLDEIYLVVRDTTKVTDLNHTNVNIISFTDKNNYINEMDSVISCTSAPHVVVSRNDINKNGNKIYIFDMAVPRDIEPEVGLLERAEVYNIDEISNIEDENRFLRLQRMNEYKYIIYEFINEYEDWKSLRELSPIIADLNKKGTEIYSKRFSTYKNKNKSLEDEDLVKVLLKSTSDVYIHRAIEVLKEEKLKGCDEECIRIVKKIFLTEN